MQKESSFSIADLAARQFKKRESICADSLSGIIEPSSFDDDYRLQEQVESLEALEELRSPVEEFTSRQNFALPSM